MLEELSSNLVFVFVFGFLIGWLGRGLMGNRRWRDDDIDPIATVTRAGEQQRAMKASKSHNVAKTAVQAARLGARVLPLASDVEGVEAALRMGQKIGAIKLYRNATGAGLRDAKQAIEMLARQLK